MRPEDYSLMQEQGSRRHLPNLISLTAGLVVVSAQFAGYTYETQAAPIDEQLLGVTAIAEPEVCQPVKAKNTRLVSRLLLNTHTVAQKYGAGTSESYDRAAQKYNMNIFSPDAYIDTMDAAKDIDSSLAIANEYFTNLEIKVTFEVDNVSHSPVTDEISVANAKMNLKRTMKAFMYIPEQVVSRLDLTTITIARNVFIDGRGYGGTVKKNKDGSNGIVLESNTLNSTETGGGKDLVLHELGHIIALKNCGSKGMNKDSVFVRLNSGASYRINANRNTVPKNDPNFVSIRAATSSPEDVAEVNRITIDGTTSKEALGSKPKNRKVRLELARFAQMLGKNFVRYLLDASFVRRS